MLDFLMIDNIILEGLKEDMPYGDITTNSTISEDSKCNANLYCKEDGIICGCTVFSRVFELIGDVTVSFFVKDGDAVVKGQKLAVLTGNTRKILQGERIALNLMQRMSGIATTTHTFAEKIKNTNASVVDTRKITPLYRYIDKYSVRCGGGKNHRYSLSDSILIKDNQIDAAGGIKNAVTLAKKNASFTTKVEVETESKQDVLDALDAKADIIMLDNMTPDMVADMVKLINGRAIVETSGNITIDNIYDYAQTGVDIISVGALTHSFKVLDISLKNLTHI